MNNNFTLNYLKALLPFTLLLVTAFLFFYTKGDIVLILNKWHTPFFNSLFVTFSSIGNAVTVFVFLLVVLRFKLKYLYFFILAFAIESVIVILCKHVIFDGVHRPYMFFKELGVLNQIDFVEGIKVRKFDSFPSGHTAYSFFIATFFSIKFNKKSISLLLLSLATLIGMSRIYLVQHFFIDVFTGAFIGVISTCIAFVIVSLHHKKWYSYRLKLRTKKNISIAFTNN